MIHRRRRHCCAVSADILLISGGTLFITRDHTQAAVPPLMLARKRNVDVSRAMLTINVIWRLPSNCTPVRTGRGNSRIKRLSEEVGAIVVRDWPGLPPTTTEPSRGHPSAYAQTRGYTSPAEGKRYSIDHTSNILSSLPSFRPISSRPHHVLRSHSPTARQSRSIILLSPTTGTTGFPDQCASITMSVDYGPAAVRYRQCHDRRRTL